MIKYLEKEDFKEEIKNGLVLVDWCGPCKMMGKVLEEIEKDYEILKVNTDHHPSLSVSYGVMSIPTLILFKNGVEIKKQVGLMSKEELLSWLKED